jgi:tRNA U34 5-carboxymethylaminomethyl modifying GTPase MnmE/TrmE
MYKNIAMFSIVAATLALMASVSLSSIQNASATVISCPPVCLEEAQDKITEALKALQSDQVSDAVADLQEANELLGSLIQSLKSGELLEQLTSLVPQGQEAGIPAGSSSPLGQP